LFERVIIATGSSNRQTKALASSVRESVKQRGMAVLATEGEDNGEWIIVDCGAAVVHLMQPGIREYYRLEEIWGGKNVRMKTGVARTGLVKASEPADQAPGRARVKAGPAGAAPAAARKKASQTGGKTAVKSAGPVAAKPTSARKTTRTASGSSGKPASPTASRTAAKTSAKTTAKASPKTSAKTAAKAAAQAAAKASATRPRTAADVPPSQARRRSASAPMQTVVVKPVVRKTTGTASGKPARPRAAPAKTPRRG
jgi:ribosome-associated protein